MFPLFRFSRVIAVLFFFLALHSAVTWKWSGNSWKNIIDYDGKGYYSYLPAVFIYHDLQWKFMDSYEKAHYEPQHYFDYTYDVNGRKINKYFCGVAVFELPFFLPAWGASRLLGLNSDGYSHIFQLSVSLASVFYFALGMYFLARLLIRFGAGRAVTAAVLLLIAFATNLFYYATSEPCMSHVYSFCAVSGFLWYLKRAMDEGKTRYFLWSAFFYGLICIIRPTNAIVILALPVWAGSWPALLAFSRDFFAGKKKMFLTLLVFVTVIGLQLMMFYLQTGKVLVWSYGHEGFNFSQPELFNVLFSYKKGLFIYTPLLLLASVGLVYMARENRFRAISLFILLFLSLYIISCWWQWWYGGSFGMRPFIEYYPFMALLLVYFLTRPRTWQVKVLAWALCITSLYYTHRQTWQYRTGMIHYADMDEKRFWNIFMSTDFSRLNGPAPKIPESKADTSQVTRRVVLLDAFDTTEVKREERGFSSERAVSGKYSVRLGKALNCSPGFERSPLEMGMKSKLLLKVSLDVFLTGPSSEAVMVICCKHGEEQYGWKGFPLKDQCGQANAWCKAEWVERVEGLRSETDKIQVYIFNPKDPVVFADNLRVEFCELK